MQFEFDLWRLVRDNQPLPKPQLCTSNFFIWRRISLFREAFADIFETGTRRDGLSVFGDLVASEITTKERGSVIFVENTSNQIGDPTVTGSVFPLLETITLSPGEIFPIIHDAPIGPSARYLDAYAGLVKSEAKVLTAHIRSDPFLGVRLFVYGDFNTQKQVVLFNAGERGESIDITFTDMPQVIPHGVSQIIALPTVLAGHVYFLPETTRIGPYTLSHAGEVTYAPRLETTLTVSALTSGRIEGIETQSLWVNGELCSPNTVDLLAGDNRLEVAGEEPTSAIFIPDGACYLQELTHWAREIYGDL
jgi:hypothetical protein